MNTKLEEISLYLHLQRTITRASIFSTQYNQSHNTDSLSLSLSLSLIHNDEQKQAEMCTSK